MVEKGKKNLLNDGTLKKNILVDTGIKFNLCRVFLLIPESLNVAPQRVLKDFAKEMNMLVGKSRQGIIAVPDMSISKALKKLGSSN